MVNGDYAPGSATVVRTPNPEPVVEGNVGLNTATAKELADLPMVTCGMAKQIIARRPYASTANL